MGSFDVLCSITGMNITPGDPIARFFILPKRLYSDWDSRNFFKEKAPLVSNDACYAMYVPFGFAIIGEYGDYGHIENIKRDKNVEMLEKFFGVSIDVLANTISNDDRWYIYGFEKPEKALKAKEAGEPYDEYDLQTSSWWKGDKPLNYEMCKIITHTDIQLEIYQHLIKTPKMDTTYEYQAKYYLEGINFFSEMLRKKIKHKKELETAKANDDQKSVDFYTRVFEFDFDFEYKNILGRCSPREHNFLSVMEFDETWTPKYVELYNFTYNLNSLHKLLMPTFYGTQQHNFHELLELSELTTKLLKEKIQWYKDYYGEDESELLEEIDGEEE